MRSTARTRLIAAAACVAALQWAPDTARGEQSREISGAQAGWAAMEKCAALASDDARHACSDDVLRRAGLLRAAEAAPAEAPAPAARPTEIRPPAALPPEARPAEAPGPRRREDFGLQVPKRETPAPRGDDRLDVKLASVEMGADGKLVLTTTEGAVWRQVESETVRPTPAQGQTMTIEKAVLGGFKCKAGRWGAFRCRRVK